MEIRYHIVHHGCCIHLNNISKREEKKPVEFNTLIETIWGTPTNPPPAQPIRDEWSKKVYYEPLGFYYDYYFY